MCSLLMIVASNLRDLTAISCSSSKRGHFEYGLKNVFFFFPVLLFHNQMLLEYP